MSMQVERTLPPCDRTPSGDEWKQQLRELLATVQSMSAMFDTRMIQNICSVIQQLIDR